MAFGQSSGPPAPAKQLAELTDLLAEAGYESLREARHPFDLTQRQANGKFTRDEASELIERLQAAAEVAAVVPSAAPAAHGAGDRAARRQADRQAEVVAGLPAELLADELVRRGWMCMPPE